MITQRNSFKDIWREIDKIHELIKYHRINQGNSYRIKRTAAGTILDIEIPKQLTALELKMFKVKNVKYDFLEAVEYFPQADPQNREGTKTYYILKPYKLRRTNNNYDLNPNNHTIEYYYFRGYKRRAEIELNIRDNYKKTFVEIQYIVPRYQEQIIYAVKIQEPVLDVEYKIYLNQLASYLNEENQPEQQLSDFNNEQEASAVKINWIDLNLDGRTWASI